MKNIKDAKNNVSLSRRRFLVGTVSGSLLMAFAPLVSASGFSKSPQETLKNKLFSNALWPFEKSLHTQCFDESP